jgi:hypothetical protein
MASKAETLVHIMTDAAAATNGVILGAGIVTKDPVLLTVGVGSGLLGCAAMLYKRFEEGRPDNIDHQVEDIDHQINDHDHS